MFDEWFEKLKRLADKYDLAYLVPEMAKESFRETFNDGLSPGEALGDEYECARADTPLHLCPSCGEQSTPAPAGEEE